MKKSIFWVMCAMTCLIGLNCFSVESDENDQAYGNLQRQLGDQYIRIFNRTGADLYVYVFKYNNNPNTTPGVQVKMSAAASGVLPNGKQGMVNLQKYNQWFNNGNRIYFSDTPLTCLLAPTNTAPDALNPAVGGNQNWSFAEYNYVGAGGTNVGTYTIDISYIDAFSFPMTIKFDPGLDPTYNGCDWGFVYGPENMEMIRNNLQAQAGPWGSLVDVNDPTVYTRIISPLSLWNLQQGGGAIPVNFQPFTNDLPFNGPQLFPAGPTQAAMQNLPGWNVLFPPAPFPPPNSDPSPETTGYAQALLASAPVDGSGRRGFFIYPQDQHAGSQFTAVPIGTPCTISVYPHLN